MNFCNILGWIGGVLDANLAPSRILLPNDDDDPPFLLLGVIRLGVLPLRLYGVGMFSVTILLRREGDCPLRGRDVGDAIPGGPLLVRLRTMMVIGLCFGFMNISQWFHKHQWPLRRTAIFW